MQARYQDTTPPMLGHVVLILLPVEHPLHGPSKSNRNLPASPSICGHDMFELYVVLFYPSHSIQYKPEAKNPLIPAVYPSHYHLTLAHLAGAPNGYVELIPWIWQISIIIPSSLTLQRAQTQPRNRRLSRALFLQHPMYVDSQKVHENMVCTR